MDRLDTNKTAALEQEVVEANEKKALELMKEFETMLNGTKTGWCLGFDQPSALDAHLVVFIARMFDVKRANLVPDRVKEYAEVAMKGEEWKAVMQGRNTFSP